MASLIEFETPENVRIGYHPAGLGTRFTAWLLDSILVTLLSILLGILAFSSERGSAWWLMTSSAVWETRDETRKQCS